MDARHDLRGVGPVAERALRLIARCEAEFGFDSGVRRVLVLTDDRRWGRHVPRGAWLIRETLKLYPTALRERALPEYVLHELGHALVARYDLRAYLEPFTRRTFATRAAYLTASEAAGRRARREGFVSGYASCDREEDFCETYAAYLTNRASWWRRLRYDGQVVPVRGDARLRRKLDAVHALLRDLREFG